MSVDFNLDLAGGSGEDGSLTWTELTDSNTDLEELFQYTINGDANVLWRHHQCRRLCGNPVNEFRPL